MKRVPVSPEQHRKAKARAAECGLTLERYVGLIIDKASREPAEQIVEWALESPERESAGAKAE